MNPVKLIVTGKQNLQFKYEKKYRQVEQLLNKIKAADKKKKLDTKIVFIDDAASAKAAGIKAVKHMSEKECKAAVDALYQKHLPAYIMIFGAQDVFPFQEIDNPADDDDNVVPSDLPYACDEGYSRNISSFTGPTRVVGRLPDVPGKQTSIDYLQTVIQNSIDHVPKDPDEYRNYFSMSAQVWKKSTELSLQNMFSDSKKLVLSPTKAEHTPTKVSPAALKALTHFYNCHGSRTDPSYWGQRGDDYPEAIRSSALAGNIAKGAVVAAECCYGAQVFDPTALQPELSSIANVYLQNGAIGLVGSSTIAYGPPDTNANADLITQFFIKSLLKGASTGRAFLEARQNFLSESGPELDPYELKTLAQFYLLGDPSVQPATCDDVESTKTLTSNTTQNTRGNLYKKGRSLKDLIAPSQRKRTPTKPSDTKRLKEILRTTNFENAPKHLVYAVTPKIKGATGMKKQLAGGQSRFHTFIKPNTTEDLFNIKVLVVKEDNEQVLGWRMYESK